MRKLTSKALIGLVALVLFLKTASTFTLCGGTLIQNWVGTGACTDNQKSFIGFDHPFMQGREFLGVVVLCFFLIVLGYVYLKYFKSGAK